MFLQEIICYYIHIWAAQLVRDYSIWVFPSVAGSRAWESPSVFSGVSSVTTRHAEGPGDCVLGVLIAEEDDGVRGMRSGCYWCQYFQTWGHFPPTAKVLGFLYQLLNWRNSTVQQLEDFYDQEQILWLSGFTIQGCQNVSTANIFHTTVTHIFTDIFNALLILSITRLF